MTAPMTAAERAEINRRNAQRSTGPRTPEGKDRAKFNALKHGMAAKMPVLPGEDAEAYHQRIGAWKLDLRPRTTFEDYMIEQAARVSWQLDRVDRAQTAILTDRICNAADDAARRSDDEVADLGGRLFRDPRGPLPLYPHFEYQPGQPRVSCAETADDPDDPARLVYHLESTAAGCCWLRDRWAELRAILDQGLAWQSPDKLKAIRLLGRQPLDAADAPEVATLFLACHAIEPQAEDAFAEIGHELLDGEAMIFRRRLAGRHLDELQPRDSSEARRVLNGIVDRAIARLAALVEVHEERAAADAAHEADRLSFDDSEQGERLRRFQISCSRTLLRTFDALLKSRRAGEDSGGGMSGAGCGMERAECGVFSTGGGLDQPSPPSGLPDLPTPRPPSPAPRSSGLLHSMPPESGPSLLGISDGPRPGPEDQNEDHDRNLQNEAKDTTREAVAGCEVRGHGGLPRIPAPALPTPSQEEDQPPGMPHPAARTPIHEDDHQNSKNEANSKSADPGAERPSGRPVGDEHQNSKNEAKTPSPVGLTGAGLPLESRRHSDPLGPRPHLSSGSFMRTGVVSAAGLRPLVALILLGAVYASPIRDRGPGHRAPRRGAPPNFLRRCFATSPTRLVEAAGEVQPMPASRSDSPIAPADRGDPNRVIAIVIPREPCHRDTSRHRRTAPEVAPHRRC